MSRNIDQVYTDNPINSNANTDLMYFGQSPYGALDDAAMTFANFAAQFPVLISVDQNISAETLVANRRYSTNNGSSLVTYTIPVAPSIGDTYIIVGGSSGGWTIAQSAFIVVNIGAASTTAGVTGSISSTNQNDCITLTCVSSNTFTGYAIQGNLTIV